MVFLLLLFRVQITRLAARVYASVAIAPPNPAHLPRTPASDGVTKRNPKTGKCETHRARDGTDCDDSNKCTVRDQCVKGVCKGNTKTCPGPTDPCKKAVCSRNRGCGFANVNDGSKCPLPSGETGVCDYGQCVGLCPDSSDPCVKLVPDAEHPGRCKEVYTTGSCDDGLACTTGRLQLMQTS